MSSGDTERVGQSRSLPGWLRFWAEQRPDALLYAFLDRQGRTVAEYTYASFERETARLAHYLSCSLEPGDRALLLYPAGLERVAAFFACMRAGVIPVITAVSADSSETAVSGRRDRVVEDARPVAVLTTSQLRDKERSEWRETRTDTLQQALPWIATDVRLDSFPGDFTERTNDVAFLQYTSGSTSEPKGVIVSHANVIANFRALLAHVWDEKTDWLRSDRPFIGVSWLPMHHDLGLIGYHLFPLLAGNCAYGFSPRTFLGRPELWFRVLSQVGATWTSAPNFAFEYCLREDRVSDADLDGVDLSRLRVMMSCAEPVRAETFERFAARFARWGLRSDAHVVAYGLAENTLAVSSRGRRILRVSKRALSFGHAEPASAASEDALALVSCGAALPGNDVRIVCPKSLRVLPEGQVGEIWVGGRSKCAGYWEKQALNAEVFCAQPAGGTREGDGYLRTGDLGFFHDGELYVSGRIKDVIIIRGANHYPQDIEAVVQASLSGIRNGGVAAFRRSERGDELVVLVEARSVAAPPDPDAVAAVVRAQCGIEPAIVAVVEPRSLRKTTSGKIARAATREAWLAGKLVELGRWELPRHAAPVSPVLGPGFPRVAELWQCARHSSSTLGDLGLDSIAMAELVAEITRLLERFGGGEAARTVDGQVLQAAPVGELLDRLEQFMRAPEEGAQRLATAATLSGQLAVARDRRRMLDDRRLGPFPMAESRARPGPCLLTGPTGALGPFLLASLLRRADRHVHVLIRARDRAHGMARLRDAFQRLGLDHPELERGLRERVRIFCGDLAEPRLGLPEVEWRQLAEGVESICHNGALVDYVRSYDALHGPNVRATRELLELAASSALKRFHMISTTFIFGWSTSPVLWETHQNEAMEGLDFAYMQTKWVAEQLAHAAAARGLDVRIYRPSLISASSAGYGRVTDIAVRLLAFMIQYGLVPRSRNQISFTPADIAAENIVALMDLPEVDTRTFHVTVDDYYNFMDITREIEERYGYGFKYLEIPEFMAQMSRLAGPDDPIFPLVDFFVRSQAKIAAMQEKRYSSQAYRGALSLCGGGRPDLSLRDTVACVVESMLREGIIPRPPVESAVATRAVAGASRISA